jgi:KUP system potassium uptake protein
MVAIATAAACVASQALISGAFSLTRQAVQLGYCPRMRIVHTSSTEIGQIYIPTVNTALMFACLGLVLGFGTSSNLAAAYGIAVAMTMAITNILLAVVAYKRWKWSPWAIAAMTGTFLLVDLSFVGANLLKVPDGGWVPLVAAVIVYVLMSTWKKGRVRLEGIVQENTLPLDLFLQDIKRRQPARVHGTAVFLTPHSNGAPAVLLHHLKHNQVLHEKVMLMSVITEELPHLDSEERVECRELGESFYQVVARYGFMETPDVPGALRLLSRGDVDGKPVPVKLPMTSYYLGRETLIVAEKRPRTAPPAPAGSPSPPVTSMARWRKKLFIFMARNAQSATAFFGIPPNRVVELGAQIQF